MARAPRNLVVCCDGTSNEIGRLLSNVLKLYQVADNGDKQVTFYQPGIWHKWEFRPAHGAYDLGLTYDFRDSEGTKLVGTCNGEPSFFVKGGAYQWGKGDFILTVDGRSWSLPIMEGAPEGRFFVRGLARTAARHSEHGESDCLSGRQLATGGSARPTATSICRIVTNVRFPPNADIGGSYNRSDPHAPNLSRVADVRNGWKADIRHGPTCLLCDKVISGLEQTTANEPSGLQRTARWSLSEPFVFACNAASGTVIER